MDLEASQRSDGPTVWGFTEGHQMTTVESAWQSELFTIINQEEQGVEAIGALQSSLKYLDPIKHKVLPKHLPQTFNIQTFGEHYSD